VVQIDQSVVAQLDLATATQEEANRPANLLPPGIVDKVFADRSEEVAGLLRSQLVHGFEVTEPEVMLAAKGRGRRPLAVLSPWERITYQALVAHLADHLPPFERSSEAYEKFKQGPIEYAGSGFVVMADVAACYQYIDHGLLEAEIVAQTGEGQAAAAIRDLLEASMGRSFGLPQNRYPSHALAECVLSLVDRRLLRQAIPLWRYSDDYRLAASTRIAAHEALELLDAELRTVGLVINEEKTSVRSHETYTRWANAVADRISAVEANFDLDFGEFILLASEYDDEDEEDEEDEEDKNGSVESAGDDSGDAPESGSPSNEDLPEDKALALLMDWKQSLESAQIRARYGPDAVVDRQIVATSLRVLGRQRSLDGLQFVRAILDSDPSLTPNIARYLRRAMANDEVAVDAVIADVLAAEELYISPWQAVWLMEPLKHSQWLTDVQKDWLKECFDRSTGFLRASAADVLAHHGDIESDAMLAAFDESYRGARPRLVSAIARHEGRLDAGAIAAVVEGRPLYRWIAEASLDV
jgi:RNA-directed DNA polymerase